MRPNPANGPAFGRLMKNVIWSSVMPCLESQSSGHSAGSIVKSLGPWYTSSIKPNVPLPPALDPAAAVDPSVVSSVVASVDVAVVSSLLAAVVSLPAVVAVAPAVVGVVVAEPPSSSSPHAATTSAAMHASATGFFQLRVFMSPLLGDPSGRCPKCRHAPRADNAVRCTCIDMSPFQLPPGADRSGEETLAASQERGCPTTNRAIVKMRPFVCVGGHNNMIEITVPRLIGHVTCRRRQQRRTEVMPGTM